MAWRRRRLQARGALALLALALCSPGARGRALEWFSAVVSTEYVDPQTNRTVRSVSESGRFGDSSPKEGAHGLVGVPRAEDRDPEGCEPYTRFLVPGVQGAAPWVALVARGGCTFKDKVLAAARRNASAVVLYNEEHYGNFTSPMSHAGEVPGRGDGVGVCAAVPAEGRVLRPYPEGQQQGGLEAGQRWAPTVGNHGGSSRFTGCDPPTHTPGALRRETSLRTRLNLLPGSFRSREVSSAGQWEERKKLKPTGGGWWFSRIESLLVPNRGSLARRPRPEAGGAGVGAFQGLAFFAFLKHVNMLNLESENLALSWGTVFSRAK